ncbi:MAG TPA: TIR domain-containing protein, partial [Candidatus Kapabacteria bacterium]|nr:TIR domain-containing protein [Candidatus Kapabacteria bacterium]
MADIFISYSSKDREKAEQLMELLASAGLSVWIDKQSLEISSSWSGEIVDAIEACKAFIILLSPHSAVSNNVAKEVSLASHYKKKILPLDLEPVELSRDLAYHLAGLHRAPMTNIDAIIRAIGKLGLEATKAPELKLVKETDGRKSLMILPFEDLSPTGDNGWFADGIANELISALSNIKALRVADQQATKDYKRYTGTLPIYAREMNIRYFIQGDVRKFGDQIKISSSLLDIETGDHLWQDSMKGTMDDIFDIQEKVAEKVVEGLKIHLASDERQKLAERGTANAEAYELYFKADEYFRRQTKEGFLLSAQLCSEAISLDPGYAQAYSSKATALAIVYRTYNRDPKLLEEGLSLLKEAKRLKPDLWSVNGPLSSILLVQGKVEEAEGTAQDFIRVAPKDSNSHFALAYVYMESGQYAKAITPYEEAIRLRPNSLAALFNIVFVCSEANETKKQKEWAEIALPVLEKHLRLFPDDENNSVSYAVILHYAGRADAAKAALRKLENSQDARSLFNIANLYFELKDYI